MIGWSDPLASAGHTQRRRGGGTEAYERKRAAAAAAAPARRPLCRPVRPLCRPVTVADVTAAGCSVRLRSPGPRSSGSRHVGSLPSRPHGRCVPELCEMCPFSGSSSKALLPTASTRPRPTAGEIAGGLAFGDAAASHQSFRGLSAGSVIAAIRNAPAKTATSATTRGGCSCLSPPEVSACCCAVKRPVSRSGPQRRPTPTATRGAC